MTQEEIRFYNMENNHKGGWFREYPFKSVGNAMHWIYVYAGLHIADSSTYGNGTVDFYGKRVATFVWDDEKGMPIFNFMGEYEHAEEQQKIYLKIKK